MAHTRDRSSYYLEQLCKIATSGGLGIVIVLLYFRGLLDFIVPISFRGYLLCSGFAILALVVLRIIFLFAHRNHQFPYEDKDTRKLWRHAVLCIPILSYFLALPGEAITSYRWAESEQSEGIVHLTIEDLEAFANDDDLREKTTGWIARVEGQFIANPNSKMIFVVKYKPDWEHKSPSSVAVTLDETVPEIRSGAKIRVTGEIQYRKRNHLDEYLPVLKLRSLNDMILLDPIREPPGWERRD
jgi:hypothetical protein